MAKGLGVVEWLIIAAIILGALSFLMGQWNTIFSQSKAKIEEKTNQFVGNLSKIAKPVKEEPELRALYFELDNVA